MTPFRLQRRQFLQSLGGLASGAFGVILARADDLPKNTNPRAIFGDSVEPDWDQRTTITVGPAKADLIGATDRVLQAAVDYVARRGGGTVRVLPGTYRLRNSVFLQSNVRILGSGEASVLFKEPSATTNLIVDGDHWDQEVTLADPEGFQVGDGVRLVAKDPHGKGNNIIQRDNDIRRSGEAGIHFRGGNKAFAPHRNRIEGNRIVDSGGEKGIGIDINGETEAVVLSKNEIRETRGRASRIGILIGAQTRDIRSEENRIEGLATPISDVRKE